MKKALAPQLQWPCITLHGWYSDGSINWFEKAFPEDIEDILCESEYDENGMYYNNEGDVESEKEDGDE